MKQKLIIKFILVIFQKIILTDSAFSHADPKFSAPISNVTVPVGREGILTCYVHDLVLFKVAWLRVDTQTILTIQNHIITKNPRIGISHTEKKIWRLKIKDVQESDKGWYMCQINTDPMKSQTGYLDVVVPPNIIDLKTSQDVTVQEGENVSLICVATGLPTPVVTWRREHSKPLYIRSDKEVLSFNGSRLDIPFISKFYTGVYLCIATNGIPPSVSKRIMVIVNFKPKIWVKDSIIYSTIGYKVSLECQSESNPDSVNYWIRGQSHTSSKDFILGGKYETHKIDNVYKVRMILSIEIKSLMDFGTYKCIAKNSLGTIEEVVTIVDTNVHGIQMQNKANSVYNMNQNIPPLLIITLIVHYFSLNL